MALKELLVDLEDFSVDLVQFYKKNPYLAAYPGKSGPVEFLKTGFDQRSIPFGNDLKGGGSSNQPFIKKKLPGVLSDPVTDWPDFLVRDPKSFLDTRKDDLERITKLLLTPQGLLFTAKQELLSLQNPLVPGRPNRSRPGAGLYYPYMTLGQVAVQGTGLHIEKQGASPIFGQQSKYEYVYTTQHNENKTNKLTILYNSKILGDTAADNTPQAKRLGISNFSGQLFNYLGGPNVGISGKTVIKIADNAVYSDESIEKRGRNFALSNARASNIKYNSKKVNGDTGYFKFLGVSNKGLEYNYTNYEGELIAPGLTSYDEWMQVYNSIDQNGTFTPNNSALLPERTTNLGIYTLTQAQLRDRSAIEGLGDTSLNVIEDFRKQILETNTQAADRLKQNQQGVLYTDYSTFNREKRVGLGNPGKRTRNRSKLNSYDNDTVDRINMLPLYADRAVLDPYNLTRDLVKFRFEVINNADPGESTFIHFRAFLGQITDNFRGEWTPTKYIGRGENFYNYSGFSRDISFTYKVHAQSRAEMKSIYQKLNYLASTTAPDYTGGYMKGNLIRLTIGDYLYIVPGFLNSLTYTIPEDAPWEIALNSPENGEDAGVMETPKLFEVSVNFTAIHDFVPRLGATRDTAFITNPTGKGDKNQYLDDSKVYFFNNQTNLVSNPQQTVLYSEDMLKAKTKDTISPDNLKFYATGDRLGGARSETENLNNIDRPGLTAKPLPVNPPTPFPEVDFPVYTQYEKNKLLQAITPFGEQSNVLNSIDRQGLTAGAVPGNAPGALPSVSFPSSVYSPYEKAQLLQAITP